MTLEEAFTEKVGLTAGITALISTRFGPHQGAAPNATANINLAHTVYTLVSERRAPTSAGPSGYVSAIMQFDHYAPTYAAARAIGEQFRLTFDGFTGALDVGGTVFVNMCLMPVMRTLDESREFGEASAPHRVMQEFTIVYHE